MKCLIIDHNKGIWSKTWRNIIFVYLYPALLWLAWNSKPTFLRTHIVGWFWPNILFYLVLLHPLRDLVGIHIIVCCSQLKVSWCWRGHLIWCNFCSQQCNMCAFALNRLWPLRNTPIFDCNAFQCPLVEENPVQREALTGCVQLSIIVSWNGPKVSRTQGRHLQSHSKCPVR